MRDNLAQRSFDALKRALSSTPLFSPPNFDEKIVLYLSTARFTITWVLVQQEDDGPKHIIYYVSKNLQGALLSYSHDEKLALAILFSIQNYEITS